MTDRHHSSNGNYEADDAQNQIGGIIPAFSLSGWLRSGMEAVVQTYGPTACHPGEPNANFRKEDVYSRDLENGYHEKGACVDAPNADDGCVIFDLFGGFDNRPGKVNESVPLGADGDAAALSRPEQINERTVPTHASHVRLSLLDGECVSYLEPSGTGATDGKIADLVTVEDATTAHEWWLRSDIAAAFNEAVYYPYTSLKYHTLLVGSLFDAYRSGYEFEDIRLVVEPADRIEPFRTVYTGEAFSLRLDADVGGRASARLGSRPCRSWASTWTRLPAHPLDTDSSRYDMVLDANLRRIRSWSTALQYIEDFEAWAYTPGHSAGVAL